MTEVLLLLGSVRVRSSCRPQFTLRFGRKIQAAPPFIGGAASWALYTPEKPLSVNVFAGKGAINALRRAVPNLRPIDWRDGQILAMIFGEKSFWAQLVSRRALRASQLVL
jgi:hypothetical protein